MAHVILFRRNLRLVDNPALYEACTNASALVCLYVHAPDEEAPWQAGAASRWWLHRSLESLETDLRRLGQKLIYIRDASYKALINISIISGASDVHVCAQVEPSARARDSELQVALAAKGVTLHIHAHDLLFEPDALLTDNGNPYRQFTPFWKKARAKLSLAEPAIVPTVPPPPDIAQGVSLDSLGLLPRIRWDQGIENNWSPGEGGAHAALADFLDSEVEAYTVSRNRPDLPGTSRLSPHLHFGELSPRQVVWALTERELLDRGEAFVREIGWREFCHHLLWHFPHTSDEPMDAKFMEFPWVEPPSPALLTAWQTGTTGIPIVDAGMRELWHTGWMHNRVRMVVASLLTKNMRIHWLHGARWFWDTLVDADLANNSAGWQWIAGSGADAAPYFRIFNPVLQGIRFDPRGDYVRRWVPELARVPAPAIHAPWKLDADEQRALGIADTVYAHPLVDLAETRAAALASFAEMRERTTV